MARQVCLAVFVQAARLRDGAGCAGFPAGWRACTQRRGSPLRLCWPSLRPPAASGLRGPFCAANSSTFRALCCRPAGLFLCIDCAQASWLRVRAGCAGFPAGWRACTQRRGSPFQLCEPSLRPPAASGLRRACLAVLTVQRRSPLHIGKGAAVLQNEMSAFCVQIFL